MTIISSDDAFSRCDWTVATVVSCSNSGDDQRFLRLRLIHPLRLWFWRWRLLKLDWWWVSRIVEEDEGLIVSGSSDGMSLVSIVLVFVGLMERREREVEFRIVAMSSSFTLSPSFFNLWTHEMEMAAVRSSQVTWTVAMTERQRLQSVVMDMEEGGWGCWLRGIPRRRWQWCWVYYWIDGAAAFSGGITRRRSLSGTKMKWERDGGTESPLRVYCCRVL